MSPPPNASRDLPTFETMRVEEARPGVALVTLDRPARLNAVSFEMFDELHALLTWAERAEAIRVLVVTGAGRGFCAGFDLDDAPTLYAMSTSETLAGQERWSHAIAGFRLLAKPVIAAVNGAAVGAGFGLALAADIRLASPSARFSAAFVRIGFSGGDVGVSWMLPRIVGLGHASEMMLTGRLIDVDHALRIGLVNEIVPAETLVEKALELAQEITANSPLGVRLTKQVLQINVDAPSLQSALDLEARNQTLCTRTADMKEALAAFREKRAPKWTGH